jgi:hypothetical protein
MKHAKLDRRVAANLENVGVVRDRLLVFPDLVDDVLKGVGQLSRRVALVIGHGFRLPL